MTAFAFGNTFARRFSNRAPTLGRKGNSLGGESTFGCFLSLARRPGLRQLLCSVSQSACLGVGNRLAGRRIFQLDHHAVDSGLCDDQRLARRPARNARLQHFLDLWLRRALGPRRPHVRPHDALSRNVPGYGCGARLYRRFRYVDAADFSRPVHFRRPRDRFRSRHSLRRGGLHARNCFCRLRGNFQRKGNVRRTEKGRHQGIQPKARTFGSDFLWRNERLLRLRSGGRRSY